MKPLQEVKAKKYTNKHYLCKERNNCEGTEMDEKMLDTVKENIVKTFKSINIDKYYSLMIAT